MRHSHAPLTSYSGETEGRLDVSIVTQPPGIATPLHRHTHEAEAFLVLEGRVSYRAGDETYEVVGPGIPE